MSTLIEERSADAAPTTPDLETSGDKPKASHIVISPNPDEGHHAYVMRARIEGFPVTAMCGFTWVPNKSAKDLPVCSECKALWDALPDDGEGWVKE